MSTDQAGSVQQGDTVFYHARPFMVTAIVNTGPNTMFRLTPLRHDYSAGKFTSHKLVHHSAELCHAQRAKMKYAKC